jgi:hypothetical protein
MEMAGRGMSFYAYQKQNEIAYLSFLNRKTQEKMQQLVEGFEKHLTEAENTINVLNVSNFFLNFFDNSCISFRVK